MSGLFDDLVFAEFELDAGLYDEFRAREAEYRAEYADVRDEPEGEYGFETPEDAVNAASMGGFSHCPDCGGPDWKRCRCSYPEVDDEMVRRWVEQTGQHPDDMPF